MTGWLGVTRAGNCVWGRAICDPDRTFVWIRKRSIHKNTVSENGLICCFCYGHLRICWKHLEIKIRSIPDDDMNGFLVRNNLHKGTGLVCVWELCEIQAQLEAAFALPSFHASRTQTWWLDSGSHFGPWRVILRMGIRDDGERWKSSWNHQPSWFTYSQTSFV